MQLHFDTLPGGLLVTAIGVGIVLVGLVVLIGLIKLMQIATGSMGQKKEKKVKKADKAATPSASPVAAAPVSDEVLAAITAAVAMHDDELIAVISAAVTAMMGEGTAFRVRRVRRISNASAWNKAGREEQVYSRF